MLKKKPMLACAIVVLLAVGALASGGEPGRVTEWLLAGSFASPQPEKLLDEDTLANPAELAASAGQAIGGAKWARYATPTGMVNLLDKEVGIARRRNAGAVAMVYVHCPKMTPAKLLLGFSDGLAAYVNGAKVFQRPDGGGVTADAHRAEVLLGEGWNRLYLKVIWYGRFRGQWGYTARILGEDLKPIQGLKFSTKSPFPSGKPKMPKFVPFVSAYHVEHFGTHRIRLANRTPMPLENVQLLVRSRTGKELMKTDLGKLAGSSYVEADIEADEIFFQQNYPGASAVVKHAGGTLTTKIGELVLPGTHTIEYVTPHIQRMKPWAAGRCAILLITPTRTRQSIELAQRGDLEWHIVDAADQKAEKRIAEELTLYKFDCIVIADKSGGREPWDWSKVPGRRYLAKAIRDGVGIVYVNPSNLGPAMEKVLGIAPGGATRQAPPQAGGITKAADHAIVAGVPLEALPPLAPYSYKFAEATKVVAKVGDRAVIAAAEQDGRRTVVLNFGRGVELIWPIRRDDFCGARLPVWERQWSLILKTILWASKKETGLTVTCSIPAKVTRADLRREKVRAKIQLGGKTGAVGRVRVDFHTRGYDKAVRMLEGPTVAGRTSIDVSLPETFLDAGENEVDVVVMTKDKKILGWATSVFEVQPRGSIGKVSVAPAKGCYLPTDELTFTVPGKVDVDGLSLHAQLVDNRGRAVAAERRTLKKGDFRETFKFTPEGLVTPVARLQATLVASTPVDAGEPQSWTEARTEEIFFVRQELVWDTYEPVLWLTRHAANWYYDIDYFKLLRNVMWIPNGWCSDYSPRGSAYYQMVYGGFNRVGFESLHFFSMNHNWTKQTFEMRRSKFSRTKDVRWLYRTPIGPEGVPVDQPNYANLPYGNDWRNSFFPLDDPGYLQWTKRKIAWHLKGVRQFNPIIYDLMDEGSYTSYARAFDFDHSPASLKQFRAWLKEQYGTLAALNTEWETQFKTWDEVMPMHIHQARSRARKAELPNYAPWVDHRRYGDIVYNRYIKHCSDSARAGGDGDAVVGIGGGQRANPYGGWDYWLVANHFTWIENYFEETDEYIRSFNSPHRKLKPCPGKDVWKSVSHGNCGFYRWVDYGHLQGDFTMLPRGTTTARQLAEVRGRGFGKLFLGAEPVDDPIGIHYSQATVQVGYALGSADQLGNGGPLNAKLGFYNMLEELGYQFKFVSYAQLEDGHLGKAGYRLMILPESAALSDKEAEQLKNFVQAGGVLLCDRTLGEWDEHGRRRPRTVLEATLGMDPKAPAEKRIGKGRVMYLASDMPVRYWRDRNSRPVEAYWKTMKDALSKAGLAEPRARVLVGGKPARRTEIRYFQLGKIRYHIVRAEVPGKYELVCAAPGHVYEMRDGRYDGNDGRIEIHSEPSFPALVAVSPYKIEVVAAKADDVKQGEVVKVSAKVRASAQPGVHALNFRVYGPDGVERRYYGATLFGKDGAAALSFQTALNEARGNWTVKVADLASGTVGVATFQVK